MNILKKLLQKVRTLTDEELARKMSDALEHPRIRRWKFFDVTPKSDMVGGEAVYNGRANFLEESYIYERSFPLFVVPVAPENCETRLDSLQEIMNDWNSEMGIQPSNSDVIDRLKFDKNFVEMGLPYQDYTCRLRNCDDFTDLRLFFAPSEKLLRTCRFESIRPKLPYIRIGYQTDTALKTDLTK